MLNPTTQVSRKSTNTSPANPSPRLGSPAYFKLSNYSKILVLYLISFNTYYYSKPTYPTIINYRIQATKTIYYYNKLIIISVFRLLKVYNQ